MEWEKRDRYKRIIGKVLFTRAVCVTPECVLSADANREQIATTHSYALAGTQPGREYANEI